MASPTRRWPTGAAAAGAIAAASGRRASSASAASCAVGAITATWSIVHDSGTTPPVGTVPYVGFSPTTPHSAAGTRIEARVSVPRLASPIPVATAIADPPLEPPGIRVGSCGLRACGLVTPSANSCVEVLPRITAPAARQRATASASASGVVS